MQGFGARLRGPSEHFSPLDGYEQIHGAVRDWEMSPLFQEENLLLSAEDKAQ